MGIKIKNWIEVIKNCGNMTVLYHIISANTNSKESHSSQIAPKPAATGRVKMAFSHDPGPRSLIKIGDLTINHGGLMGFNGDIYGHF